MNAVYEYLFMGLMLIVIFAVSIEMVGVISIPMQGVSDRQALQVTGEKIMVQLLSKGLPENWGETTETSSPNYFGLASQGQGTREEYVLDASKIERLNPDDPYRLSTNTVEKSLNLERTFGFALQITPIFDTTIERVANAGNADNFTVNVRWHDNGLPVSDAMITAQLFYAKVHPGPSIEYGNGTQLHSITGVDGSNLLPLDFTLGKAGNSRLNGSLKILFVVIDHLGVKDYRLFNAGDVPTVPAYQIGNQILINNTYTALTSSPELFEIIATKDYQTSTPTQNRYAITSFHTALNDRGNTIISGKTYHNYTTTDVEPLAAGFFVVEKGGTNYLTILSKEEFLLQNTKFSFDTRTSPADRNIFPPGVQLERLVSINENLYTLRLNLWRLSN